MTVYLHTFYAEAYVLISPSAWSFGFFQSCNMAVQEQSADNYTNNHTGVVANGEEVELTLQPLTVLDKCLDRSENDANTTPEASDFNGEESEVNPSLSSDVQIESNAASTTVPDDDDDKTELGQHDPNYTANVEESITYVQSCVDSDISFPRIENDVIPKHVSQLVTDDTVCKEPSEPDDTEKHNNELTLIPAGKPERSSLKPALDDEPDSVQTNRTNPDIYIRSKRKCVSFSPDTVDREPSTNKYTKEEICIDGAERLKGLSKTKNNNKTNSISVENVESNAALPQDPLNETMGIEQLLRTIKSGGADKQLAMYEVGCPSNHMVTNAVENVPFPTSSNLEVPAVRRYPSLETIDIIVQPPATSQNAYISSETPKYVYKIVLAEQDKIESSQLGNDFTTRQHENGFNGIATGSTDNLITVCGNTDALPMSVPPFGNNGGTTKSNQLIPIGWDLITESLHSSVQSLEQTKTGNEIFHGPMANSSQHGESVTVVPGKLDGNIQNLPTGYSEVTAARLSIISTHQPNQFDQSDLGELEESRDLDDYTICQTDRNISVIRIGMKDTDQGHFTSNEPHHTNTPNITDSNASTGILDELKKEIAKKELGKSETAKREIGIEDVSHKDVTSKQHEAEYRKTCLLISVTIGVIMFVGIVVVLATYLTTRS